MIEVKMQAPPNNGGSQFVFASVCESKKIKTSPVAILAPAKRANIKPDLSASRTILTFGKCWVTY